MSNETKIEVIEISASVQEKYFLISKRLTAIWFGVLVMFYMFVVLSSEFVFSVTSLSEKQVEQLKSNIQKIPCAAEKSEVDKAKIPQRSPWFLQRYRSGAEYIDILFNYPNCASLAVVGVLANPHGGSVVYYFDRATDKPVIKVTYESLK